MKNGKVTLLAVATMAAVAITAQGVHANEIDQPNPAEHTELTAGSKDTGKTVGEITQAGAEAEPTETATTEIALGNNEPSGRREVATTTFEKNGSEIVVNNPKVELDQSNGNGKYQGFTVEYKDINFPDEMPINEGDKVTFKLPEEITFQTSYEFDVKNPENNVVGKASTDPASQTVTTVFNNYFKEHPLNKQMSLKLDAKWTDKVESGKPVNVNFNGTVVTANIGKEQEIGKDELISKWGSQDKDDPTTINWTIRVNYAKRLLNYVKIIDQMSDNQKLVDDYFVINYVDSVTPWIDKGSALDLIKSMAKSEHGFEITMDRLDRMVYIWYKTKLTNAVKESTNPTNKVELKAENDGATSSSRAVLVGGRGDAKGENKPVFELPNEAPVYDKPEINIEGIPLLPPAPIVDIPEWKGGTVPFDAPKHEKPEFEGGIPGIPEVREKPEYTEPIGTVPFDAPVLDLPELEIPDEPVKPSLEPKEEKPSTPTPKTETKKETVSVVNKVEVKQDEPFETYSAPAQLPETGSDFGVVISLFGLSCLLVGSWLKKED
ncbi:SIALI-17 repeat-containing surface protein [Streptococcus sp. 343_SSPC]|uniref:SIALI-17 repeat-containing surface protein n=1 Tax=Streptococcus sp. 343_SSPC TaxID=1579342 RepID=UPI00069F3546|nr:SIALI-17 repeat-containing surface protein [Streptococcus sp. 343_SSPC]